MLSAEMNRTQLPLKLRLKSFFILMLPKFLLVLLILGTFGLLFFLSRTPLDLYWYGVQLSLFFYSYHFSSNGYDTLKKHRELKLFIKWDWN